MKFNGDGLNNNYILLDSGELTFSLRNYIYIKLRVTKLYHVLYNSVCIIYLCPFNKNIFVLKYTKDMGHKYGFMIIPLKYIIMHYTLIKNIISYNKFYFNKNIKI